MTLPQVSFPSHLPPTALFITSALAFPKFCSSQTLLNSLWYWYSHWSLEAFSFFLGQPLTHFHLASPPLLSVIFRCGAMCSTGAQQLWGTGWLFTYRKGRWSGSDSKIFSLPFKNRLAKHFLRQELSRNSSFCLRDDCLRYLFSLFYVLTYTFPLVVTFYLLANTPSSALTYPRAKLVSH